MTFSLRTWATPALIAAFLIMGATGILMFLHLDTGPMKGIHQWAGLVMVVAGVSHLVLNWRAFKTYLNRPIARVIMGFGAVALGLSFLTTSGEAGPGAGIFKAVDAVSNAPIADLAELTDQPTDAVLSRLVAAGFVGAAADTTIAALAKGDRGQQSAAIDVVFPTASN